MNWKMLVHYGKSFHMAYIQNKTHVLLLCGSSDLLPVKSFRALITWKWVMKISISMYSFHVTFEISFISEGFISLITFNDNISDSVDSNMTFERVLIAKYFITFVAMLIGKQFIWCVQFAEKWITFWYVPSKYWMIDSAEWSFTETMPCFL